MSDSYMIGDKGNKRVAGYVRERVGYRADYKPLRFQAREQAYIVIQEDMNVHKNQVKQVAIIYRGSNTKVSLSLDTASDWVANDIPAGTMAIINDIRKSDDVENIPTMTTR